MSDIPPTSLPRRQTDPIWIQSWLGTDHSETTPNATATFVERRGKRYAITCRHVLDSVDKRVSAGNDGVTLALSVDSAILNLSGWSGEGRKLGVLAPEPTVPGPPTDIAIAPLPASYWELLTTKKNKTAIDLDSWREPNWKDVRLGLAVGYPTEGKVRTPGDRMDTIETQCIEVCAAFDSIPARDAPDFYLASQLDTPHGYSFSGMSGGPVYAIQRKPEQQGDGADLLPIGITYRGHPSTHGTRNPGGFLTNQHIVIRAVRLTPDTFDEWLSNCRP